MCWGCTCTLARAFLGKVLQIQNILRYSDRGEKKKEDKGKQQKPVYWPNTAAPLCYIHPFPQLSKAVLHSTEPFMRQILNELLGRVGGRVDDLNGGGK